MSVEERIELEHMSGYARKYFASEHKEAPADNFLIWFIDEQVEEEASLDVILTNLKRSEGNEAAILKIQESLY